MNRLSKIFLAIIVVLTVALITVTVMYLKQRDLIYEYMGNYQFTFQENNNNTVTND